MSEPVTNRRILNIALPIVLSNATVPILGAVDTGVVGQIGLAAPIGAVGIGAVILTSIFWLFGFLRMGTSGLVAQARGAGDVQETGALLMRGLMIAAFIGILFILFQVPIFLAAFSIAPASAEVETLAQEYLAIRIWGAPATISLYALTGWLIAMEKTRGILALQVAMNALNVGLDLWFVLGLGFGVAGVAAATLIAECTGFVFALFLCREAFTGNQWRAWARVFDRRRLQHMAMVNGDIMVRSLVLQLSFTGFLFLGAGLGDGKLAANQVLLQFLSITSFALDGFAFAAESLVGQSTGAGDRSGLRRVLILISKWGAGFAIALSAVFLLFGPALIDLMSTSPDVRLEARRYLPWVVIAPVVGVASWLLDGVFIGATQTRALRNAMIVSASVYAVAVAIFLPLMGNHGLWLALMVLNIARGITLARRYPALEAAIS